MATRTSSISRQHVFSGERLQTFSDAVFSIIATFSVVPLKFDRAIVVRQGGYRAFNLETFLLDQWVRYIVYLYSFYLVADVWFIHTGMFSVVEQVDDVIIWLNLLLLFIVSFVPYATGLVSGYGASLDSEQIAISICAGVILLTSINIMIILGYAFRRQSFLHPHLVNNSNIRTIKVAVYIALSIKPILALLAIGFSFLTETISWLPQVLFYSIVPMSLLVRFIFYTFFRWKKSIDKLPSMAFRSVANKSRTEAFSDGVFAIVATLIVLDLTSENLPDKDELTGTLQEALFKQRFVFLSYLTTFMITGLLWFVQYSMFHFIKKFTPALSIANIVTLFLVGGIPFVAEINSVFSDETFANRDTLGPNKILSIRVTGILVTLAGISQLFFWCVAHHQKSHCMSEEVENRNAESLVFAKTLVIPVAGIIVYWGTFDDNFVTYHLYTVVTFITPFVFLLLKGIMILHWRCCRAVNRAKSKVVTSIKQTNLPSPVSSVDSMSLPLLNNKEKEEFTTVEINSNPINTQTATDDKDTSQGVTDHETVHGELEKSPAIES